MTKSRLILILFTAISVKMITAQTLEKMNWFNEPDKWHISNAFPFPRFKIYRIIVGIYIIGLDYTSIHNNQPLFNLMHL